MGCATDTSCDRTNFLSCIPLIQPIQHVIFLLVPFLALMGKETIHGKAINSLIGPYIAYGERYYMCEPDNSTLPWRWYLRASHFNPRKPKELQRITGNFTASTYVLDDSCWFKAIVDTRSNNQWKENAFVFNFKNNGCRTFKENIPVLFNQLLKMGGVEGACKLKPGVYEMKNATIDRIFPNVPIMPYGHYRFRLLVGKAENVYCCWVADCCIIPKPE